MEAPTGKNIAQPETCEFSFIWGLGTTAQETASLLALTELLQRGSGEVSKHICDCGERGPCRQAHI